LVAGAAIFGNEKPSQVIAEMRKVINKYSHP
jgi:hypothetical protein